MDTEKRIIRVLRYKNAANRLRALGFNKVYSENLADIVGVSGYQVRKDFSLLGIAGKRKGGYEVESLIQEINAMLGKTGVQKFVVAGIGNMGKALLRYPNFEPYGIRVLAGFEIDGAKVDREADVPVLPMDEMAGFIRENRVKLGIIAVPENAAQSVLLAMTEAGVKGVLNFAPISLRGTEECVINNVNLALEMENLIYQVNALDKRRRA